MEGQTTLEKLKKALAYESEQCIGFTKNLTDELLYTARTDVGKAKRLQILNKIAKVPTFPISFQNDRNYNRSKSKETWHPPFSVLMIETILKQLRTLKIILLNIQQKVEK